MRYMYISFALGLIANARQRKSLVEYRLYTRCSYGVHVWLSLSYKGGELRTNNSDILHHKFPKSTGQCGSFLKLGTLNWPFLIIDMQH